VVAETEAKIEPDGMADDLGRMKCPRIVYTDLDRSWLLCTFGDEGWRAHASRRFGREERWCARARAIGDHGDIYIKGSMDYVVPAWWMTMHGSSRQEEASGQQIEPCAAKHLALQHLQPVDVPFDRALTPG
jgi:hypothetical protein